jgi:hypothetical protein
MGPNNNHFLEANDIIFAFGPVAPSSATVQRFSMKNYQRASILVLQNKGAGNGSAITIKQCKEVDDNPVTEKAFEFTEAFRSLAVGTQAAPVNAWEKFAVTSNTFTTDATNGTRDAYMIDIKAEDLDIANDFDVVELELGNAASNVIAVVVLLFGARDSKFPPASGIAD